MFKKWLIGSIEGWVGDWFKMSEGETQADRVLKENIKKKKKQRSSLWKYTGNDNDCFSTQQ